MRHPLATLVVLPVLLLVAMLLVQRHPGVVRAQTSESITTATTSRAGFAGDAACQSCHADLSSSYGRTAHHLTSQMPSAGSILGSFAPPGNTLAIAAPTAADPDGPRLSFRMDARDGRFTETAIADNGTQHLTHSEPIDVVVGSGTRGQTYLFWSGDQLFELPISFWTDGRQWINSPGYRDGTANFRRRVDPRCLECHATAIQPLSPDPQTNLYDRSSLVPGISCESCHGPGAEHVRRERADPHRKSADAAVLNPTSLNSASLNPAKSAKSAILNPAHFPRDREIDQCALCHNGTGRQQLRPAFTYTPGEPLDRYLAPAPAGLDEHPDVHGNQVGLLERSRCFLSSPAMTCSTCHNVHAPEQTAAAYSPRCLSCHAWQSCGLAKSLGPKIQADCIGCHMPVQPTPSIVSTTAGQTVRASIRTHWIKVYPELR